ncbi:PKP4 [Cordylochernes scorpioides]|uniref:PKP4 n=1 Tax=Cordylochernes scorpioides TaxID=51811 RepID=A0ABY6KKN4_9ARAC|nr:PKP4 [Cordylochernes scorpioides]
MAFGVWILTLLHLGWSNVRPFPHKRSVTCEWKNLKKYRVGNVGLSETGTVKTVTKVIHTRDVRHVGLDGRPLDPPQYTNEYVNYRPPPNYGFDTVYGHTDGARWRYPDLHEVIEFLSHANSIVRANAAAYLQHLCYMDDIMKQKTR